MDRCPICERFMFAHSDEEGRWCYDLYLERQREPATVEEPRREPMQTSWLDLPIHRDSVNH